MRPTPLLVALAAVYLLTAAAPQHSTAQTTPVVFAGFEHQPIGSAQLSVDPAFISLKIDNLASPGGGVVYQLDAEGGVIRFGDGIRGARPTSGSWNVQGEYRYGGGSTPSVAATATRFDLTLAFDFGPLTTAPVRGTLSEFGSVIVEGEFAPFVPLLIAEFPGELSMEIDQGEMVLCVRWELPVIIVLPNQQTIPCDEAIFRSQTGGVLAGEELGSLSWQGMDLDAVEFLGELYREGGNWYEISGDLLLNRTPLGLQLTHVVQQGPGGVSSQFPGNPCLDLNAPTARQSNGIAIEELVLQAEPEIGTRVDNFNFMTLPNETRARIPTHSAEWTNLGGSDPGMTLLGGFAALGALTYTVQVFDDGLWVASQSGLSAEVARTKQYVMRHNQTDLDFLNQRASAQIDLGADMEITILSSGMPVVTGDRIHIIPEQLQIFPECVEGVAAGIYKVPDITLKRGVVDIPLPPATVFGLEHQAQGDAVMQLQNGVLIAANEYWGPGATGPFSGSVRTPVGDLQGFRWELAGDLIPMQLPPGSQRSFLLNLMGSIGGPAKAGLIVEAQGGQFAIATDFAGLGSDGAEVEAWLGSQRVYSGVLLQQGRVLVDADFNEVAYEEDDDGIVQFDLRWDSPQSMLIDGQPVFATRVSERLRHRNRAVTIFDYERLAKDSPRAEIHRASVRTQSRWLSAVGDATFVRPLGQSVQLQLSNPTEPSGAEVDAEQDAQGNSSVDLRVADPAQANVFDGDEHVTLLIQEEDTAAKAPIAPALVYLDPQAGQWAISVDFAAAGYTRFRVAADGAGELLNSPVPTGAAATASAWPESYHVSGTASELVIRLSFDGPTTVSAPGSGVVTTEALNLVATGAGRPPFGAGHVQFLGEGLQTMELLASLVVVSAPEDTPPRAPTVQLHSAVPNPFNPRTELRYELGTASKVTLTIYDRAGRRVRTLLRGLRPAGPGSVIWDGRDDRGRAVVSGVYFARMQAGQAEASEKLVLVR